jgi:eukaryotic-like serine/threonine-protein kinase
MSTPLTPAMWARVSAILDELLDAREIPVAAVDERCDGDEAVRDHVMRLLRAHRRAEGFLSQAVMAAPALEEALDALETTAPESVGPWRIVREIGRGGMGVVYLAERSGDDFNQLGALKLVRLGAGTRQIVARFRRERRILASLHHSNIARLLDGGRAADGRPYMVMEYVEGQPLTAYCSEQRLGVDERLRLFVAICDAVQHAHAQLVVHRDLKPSNILVTPAGQPRLLDFGIAKVLAEDETDGALTRTGLPVMTPEYAAPEQLRGEPVSTATDVYALGLILYELLTGRRVFANRTIAGPTSGAVPPRPSAVAEGRALRRRLTGDLETMVLKAMHDDPGRRYPSVEALARDIDRHLAGLPVSARPDTLGYRARKFAIRHRWGVAVTAAAGIVLVAFAATMAEEARRTARQRDRAERVSHFLVELFNVSSPFAQGGSVTAREILDRGAQRIETELAAEPEMQGDLLDTMGKVYWTLGVLGRAEQLYARAVDLRTRVLGADNPRTLVSMNSLANVLVREGRLEQGTRLLSDTLNAQRRVFGAEHVATLKTMNDLAFWLGTLGRYAESERLHREVLAARRRRSSPDDGWTVWSLNDLSVVVARQGRYAEAEALMTEGLAIWTRIKRPGNADVFNESLFRGTLAGIYQRQRRYVEAEKQFRGALTDLERVMGSENPHTLTLSKEMATFLAVTGHADESDKLQSRTLEISRRVFGPHHLETLQSAFWLSIVYRDEGRLAEAERLQVETLEAQRNEFGPDYPDTLLSRVNLGRIAAKRGRITEAEGLLRDTMDRQRRLFGERFPDTVEAMFGLACVAALDGRRAEALDTLGQALATGYLDPARLEREPDLAGLRDAPEFQRLASGRSTAEAGPSISSRTNKGRQGVAPPARSSRTTGAEARHRSGSAASLAFVCTRRPYPSPPGTRPTSPTTRRLAHPVSDCPERSTA